MNDKEKLEELIRKYAQAIHTQEKDLFYSIWTNDPWNVLISNSNKYEGLDNIYKDFLIGGIQDAYRNIDLIVDNYQINYINETLAIIILEYHTECIRRETNEYYGIAGLETQIVQKSKDGWKLVHIQYHGKEIEKNNQ